MMVYSRKGLEFTAAMEGCKLKAYLDTGGIPTIGVGHTKGVKMGDTCTQEQAMQMLQEDVKEAEAAVIKLVRVPLTQGQYDALVDFAFNLGPTKLALSTLLKKLNASDYAGAADQFLVWNKGRVNGELVVLGGLDKRCKGRKAMFIA